MTNSLTRFACAALAAVVFSACYFGPDNGSDNTPLFAEPDATPRIDAGIDFKDAGTVTCTGNECVCDSTFSCVFTCPDGDCEILCAEDSQCDIDCQGGGCLIDCAPGATCNSLCTQQCELTCQEGASCAQECTGGAHALCTCEGC